MARILRLYYRHFTGYNILKFFIIGSLFFLQASFSFAQPVWTASPTVTAPHSTKIDVSYTLNETSTLYYFGLNYNYAGTFTSAQVKAFAMAGPSGQRVCAGSVNYSTPGVSSTLTFTNFPANTQVTLFMVAESFPGALLQVTSIKLSASTLPCVTPDYLSGFSQSVVCVNKGASATYLINLQTLDPDLNGILSGTTWVLDWGDGTAPANYISTADNDLPPVGLRTHTYSSVTNCNYIFSCMVTSPCGLTKQNQFVAVVHGRDLAADGDGHLALVDNATGSNIITVCAGTQTDVTIRDNSVWNCQNPTVPNGFTAIPNNDPRNIEWLYGRDPSGAIMNTITGTVTISALGNAPVTSTRITPAPYGPSSVSNIITIPATCQTGEYFRVYLKNWNKCNWLDPEAIATYIDITVVNAPPAPVVPDKTICLNGNNTLSVTSTPVGTIEWYSDASLTTMVSTGPTYTPSVSLPGAYDYWVTDFNSACRSASTKVTLTIRPGPAIIGPSQPVRVTASNINYTANAGYTNYIWNLSSGGVIISGGATSDNFINVNWNTEGTKTINLGYTDPGYGCTGSVSANEFIYPLPSANNVQISGTLYVGSILTGSYNYTDGAGGPEGASIYRWLRNGTVVVGTGITYLISTGDQNSTLTFEVTPVSTTGIPNTGLPVMSSPTSPVENLSEIPVASEVCIEGIREAGNWIRGKYKYIHSLPEGNSVYKWYRDGSPISGATIQYYQLTNEDITGKHDITFEVTPVSSNSIPNTGNSIISIPLARITLSQDNYSVAINSVPLTANTLQGVFSGAFVMNGIFYPKQAGVGGPYQILFYTSIVNTIVTCFQEASENLMVIPNESLFSGIDSVYCKDGPEDIISVTGIPPSSVSLGFSLTDPDAIVSQTEWTATLSPSQLNAGIKKDILTFRYQFGGYEYIISHSLKVDSAGSNIQFVNLNPEYCSNSPKQNISVSGVYPSGSTATWGGPVLSDITNSSASIDVSLGTPGTIYTITCQYNSPLGCKSNLISGNVVINQAPSSFSVASSDPLTLCLGDSATLRVDEIPGYNYQWKRDSKNIGINSSTYEAKLAGNYTLVVSDSRGCSAVSSNSVTVADVNSQITTTFRVNGPVAFCQGGSVTMSVTNNPDYTYQWTRDGSDIANATINSYTAQTAGVYALKVTNISGCRNKTEDISVTVSALPEIPLISASGNLEFCQGDSVILSIASIPGYSYHWKLNGVAIGSDKNSLSAKNSGTYTLTVSNAAGCSVVSYNSVRITVYPIPFVQQLSLNGPSTFCKGSSVVLSVIRNESNTYQWLKNGINVDDSTSNSFAAKEPGTYSLIIMNEGGCTFRTGDAVLSVLEAPVAPSITSVGPLDLCIGDSTVLSFTNPYGYSCRWFRNGNVFANSVTSVTAKSAGKYSLVVTNTTGCSSNAANTIDLKDVNSQVTTTFRVNGPTEFCRGNSVGLSVSNNPDYFYQWIKDNANIPGATTNSYTAADSGTYFLHVMNSSGCKNKTEDIRVIVFPNPGKPLIKTDGLLETCEGDSVILSVDYIQGHSYQWKLNGGVVGANSNRHISRNSGTYTILISNIYGCSAQSVNAIEALFHPLPLVGTISQIGNDKKFCKGESISLSVPLNTSYKYAWKNNASMISDASSNQYTARESGKYTVEVTSEKGCSKVPEAVNIDVVEMPAVPTIDPGIYFPKMCLNENYLKLSVKDTVPNYTYRWYRNGTPFSTAKSLAIQDEGTYYLEASYDICTSKHDSLIVEFNENTLPKPDITAHGPTIWYLNTTSDADYFKWSYNGDIIPGAENRYYIAHQNYGIYRVGVSNDRDCYSFSDTIKIPLGTTGIEESYPFENIKIYPNPARNIITVEMDNSVYGRLRVEVLSQNGSKILIHEFEKSAPFFSGKIDLSGRPTGIYFIKISAENYLTTRILILE